MATALQVFVLSAVVALTIGYASTVRCREPCRPSATVEGAQRIRYAATRFLTESRARTAVPRCPGLPDLVAGGFLEPDERLRDGWGHPFRIQCKGTSVDVVSPGRDGRFGTPDDVR